MKGVKTMSLANATSKRFQSDDIITQRIHLPDGIEVVETIKQLLEQNKKLTQMVSELQSKLKEVDDKVNSFEVDS